MSTEAKIEFQVMSHDKGFPWNEEVSNLYSNGEVNISDNFGLRHSSVVLEVTDFSKMNILISI